MGTWNSSEEIVLPEPVLVGPAATSWLGATFNHTYFPIPHHGSVCSDCHLVSTNYATFSCINCHTQPAHSQVQTDPQHDGVGGYVYGATTCYNCHKGGGGG